MNLSLTATLLALAPAWAASQDTAHVVLVATTDVHGHVYHWDYVADREAPWGLTRAATVVDSLRASYPGRVIVVDAGDLIQGSPFATFFASERPGASHPVVEALNAVRYDAVTPGNHEFDWGLDVFAQATAAAAFPIVSGNIYRLPRDTLAYPSYVMLWRGDARIGIAGFTTPGTMVWNGSRLAGRVRLARIAPEARRTFEEMAAAGADLRVALVHSGLDGPSSYDTTGIGAEHVAAELAALPIKPHVVVVGHSHRRIADSVIDGVHFIQPPPHARGVVVAHVWLVGEGVSGKEEVGSVPAFPTFRRSTDRSYRVVRIASEIVSLENVAPHPLVTRRLRDAHVQVRTWLTTPLAHVVGDWSGWYARAEDTPIIDFVNEVQRRVSGAQLSATSAFNPQATFGPGEVRLRDVAGLYPYENTLTAVRIDGATLKAYLERSARYYRTYAQGERIVNDSVPGYDFDIVSGVEYVLDLTQPVGSRVRQLVRDGLVVEPTDTFTIAVNGYRQSGGGGFEMLAGLPVLYRSDRGIRELLVEHVRAVETLRADAYFEPSWAIVPDAAAAAVRAAFGAPPPAADSTARAPILPDTVPTVDPEPVFEPAGPARAPVATLKFDLDVGAGEHALGRLVADAYRNAVRAHFALVPNGRIAGRLPAGPLDETAIAQVLPGDGRLAVVELRRDDLEALLEDVVSGDAPSAHVSGLAVRYDARARVGRRIRSLRFPDGRGLDGGETYRLALPAALLGPDERSMSLPGAAVAVPARGAAQLADVTERTALADYLRVLRQPVEAPPSPRVVAQ